MLAFDTFNMMSAGLILKYISRDMDFILGAYFVLNVVVYILFLVFIPESPKWLFMKKGMNNQEGIRILNYISKFNGSSKVLPKDSVFDLIG